ncbi:hypothetical protein [Escherichia coli]|uniref:hypothetical protein n=1 Tax=Escherichia coli TaxID=562 RepID=UPI00339C940F
MAKGDRPPGSQILPTLTPSVSISASISSSSISSEPSPQYPDPIRCPGGYHQSGRRRWFCVLKHVIKETSHRLSFPFTASLICVEQRFAPAQWQRPCPFPDHEKLYEVVRLRLQGFFEGVGFSASLGFPYRDAFSSAFFLFAVVQLFLWANDLSLIFCA